MDVNPILEREGLHLIQVLRFHTANSSQNCYFVLRSNNAIDIETSAAHDVWTSSSRVNKILDKAYARSMGHVVMFFSVTLGISLSRYQGTNLHWNR